jgi:hypothetical protein
MACGNVAWRGRGTAWSRHGMCELAFKEREMQTVWEELICLFLLLILVGKLFIGVCSVKETASM